MPRGRRNKHEASSETQPTEGDAVSTETFQYSALDVSEMPPRNTAGRPASQNPHLDAVKEIAGTGQARAFTVLDPDAHVVGLDDTPDRDRLINRHVRYLRQAAHACERGVRVATTLLDNGYLQIKWQDVEYVRRPRKPKSDEFTEAEGYDE